MSHEFREGAATLTSRGLGAPAEYDDLRRYLADPVRRRRALGVTENTIAAWDRHLASRIRREQAAKVHRLVWTCRRIASFFPRESDVGAFLFSPQVALGNREPVLMIRLLGDQGAQIVVRVVIESRHIAESVEPVLSEHPLFSNEQLWEGLREGLSDAALRRVYAGIDAAKDLTEAQGSTALIG